MTVMDPGAGFPASGGARSCAHPSARVHSSNAAVEGLPNWEVAVPNYEGLRVNVREAGGRSGWILSRMSLHDPIVIFNVESEVSSTLNHGTSSSLRSKICEVSNAPHSRGGALLCIRLHVAKVRDGYRSLHSNRTHTAHHALPQGEYIEITSTMYSK